LKLIGRTEDVGLTLLGRTEEVGLKLIGRTEEVRLKLLGLHFSSMFKFLLINISQTAERMVIKFVPPEPPKCYYIHLDRPTGQGFSQYMVNTSQCYIW